MKWSVAGEVPGGRYLAGCPCAPPNCLCGLAAAMFELLLVGLCGKYGSVYCDGVLWFWEAIFCDEVCLYLPDCECDGSCV